MLSSTAVSLVLGHDLPKFSFGNHIRYVDVSAYAKEDLFPNLAKETNRYIPPIASSNLAFCSFSFDLPGDPKLLMISHGLLGTGLAEDNSIQKGDRVTIIDCALEHGIWSTLAHGATLVILPVGDPESAPLLTASLEAGQVSSLIISSATLRTLHDNSSFTSVVSTLRSITIVADFEPVLSALIRSVQSIHPAVTLSTLYRARCLPIGVLSFVVPPSYERERLPIGLPNRGIVAYVVDGSFRPVPPGVCGELILVGEMLRGVLSDKDSDATPSFVELDKNHVLGPCLAFRTGDLVRQTADGNIELV